MNTTYCVELRRDGSWRLVGQYTTRAQAARIAADYRRRGERVRITTV